jgi:hypothetical protein
MPRYCFILRWPDREHRDDEGTDLPNDAAARDYAHRMIRELKEGGGYDEPSLAMVVTNESGRQLFVIPFGFIPWRTLN